MTTGSCSSWSSRSSAETERITRRTLSSVGIESEVCLTVDALVDAIGQGVGALVLVEEALVPEAVAKLTVPLRAQEPWSDLPIIVSARETSGGRDGMGVLRALGALGNVTIVERPVRLRAMIGAVESALRARRRQYETRALLRRLEHLVASERARPASSRRR